MRSKAVAAAFAALIGITGFAGAGNAAETPKYGGTLTYMIAADAPPSFDGHREGTFATLHAFAPFYSVLIRVNPQNPSSTTAFVCDLCTQMPKPRDGGKTYTFRIRKGVKFEDGSPLTAYDVAASWNEIVFPPTGVLSARAANYRVMIDKIEAPDATTVVFHLNFPTSAFLPALADPFAWIYEKRILDRDPHWYEQHVMGSGPFNFAGYQVGQSVEGVRNPNYYHKGLPFLDGFEAIYAAKEVVRVDAIRADRAAIDFRSLSPSSRDQLKAALARKIAVQQSDWACGNIVMMNENKKPFDDVRVRRALTLAINRWKGARALSRIAIVKRVGGLVYPDSPLAMSKEELQKIAGFWPDIEKSRAEARHLLKEANAEGLRFEMLNRNVDQPYKYVGTWLVDQWSKIGVHVNQRMLPTGPWLAAGRSGNYTVFLAASLCRSIVNPLLDVQVVLPHSFNAGNFGYFEDPHEIDLYNAMLRETDPQKQRRLMNGFEKYAMDTKAHTLPVVWWNRVVPYRTYVNGWKVSPSEYVNQDLSHIWLSPPHCGRCASAATKAAAASMK